MKTFNPTELDISSFKSIGFGQFELKVPKDWKKIEAQGIDSYVIQLVSSDLDTISSDLGFYSNDLSPYDTLPSFLDRSFYNSLSESDLADFQENGIIIYDEWNTIDREAYLKTTEEYYLVDGYKSRIVTPKTSGISFTGIYIEKLSESYGRPIKFNMYGNNLTRRSEIELLHAISTLKFKM